jgi:NAD(P)-dependent dehydrogenase (short-subunit alcohol dehydrogenase family)
MARKPTPRPKAQRQTRQPGRQYKMRPRPEGEAHAYHPSGRLSGRVAIVTGGDSGIGRAVAIAFAKEGARVAIVYLEEDRDAHETERLIAEGGGESLLLRGDVGTPAFCQRVVARVIKRFGRLDILVNNAGEQHTASDFTEITPAQIEKTFRTNIFAMFFLTQAALAQMKAGAAIINTASVTAYRGNPRLIDYSSTKGAIVSFTRSLAAALAEKNIRVNGVAPGPIWTPLIPASFSPKHVKEFGKDTPMKRPGQPDEVAPAYVYLASDDASYVTGQMIHVNGGEPVAS